MDWEEYKRRCDSPQVLSRWLMEQTLELLSDGRHNGVRAALLGTMQGARLPKPQHFRAGPETDMFEVHLSAGQAAEVLERVNEAVAAGERSSGTAGRGLGGFAEAWAEYLRWRRQQDDSA